MNEIPEVHPLNFALKYNPPTLVLHYQVGKDRTQEFAHHVRVFLKENATVAQIVNELVREEPLYFHPNLIPREQLERLVQRLVENKGKKVGRLKLKPEFLPEQKKEKEKPKEIPPKAPAAVQNLPPPKEQRKVNPPQKESPAKEEASPSPSPPTTKEAKKIEASPGAEGSSQKESPESKSIVEKSTPEKSSPTEDFKAPGSADSGKASDKSSEEAKAKRRRDIRERFGMPHAPAEAKSAAPHEPAPQPKENDILVESNEGGEAEGEHAGPANSALDERFVRKNPGEDDVVPADNSNNAQDEQQHVAGGDEEVIVGETGEGEGPPIVLQKVMIQDLNQEFLMDEQGNLYDMEGHYVGKVDEGAEEGEEDPGNEAVNYEGNNVLDGNDGSPEEGMPAVHEQLPDIPPINQRKHHQPESKKRPLI